ncbi:cytochrome c biogenesis CcdA family protein [Edwardsiella piscicida]|uniref:cytochrome c biogenesis CcdA family protein n=1 Tax=Edwardsiella piscicida TaxID=1263550 RepID=UPI0002C0B2EA|nr:cytochrome c biogenesis CcdA family protein [Edwardsiella piscicida]AGH74197.1 Cytochrome c-type biogenesis protein CcdA [Edwardsiella piscicida C07-087]EKS7780891.1 cytochrome c biogenesis protein CcdA [Edwardsiella piscicida]EKS7783616.1 cytochrome c biogenesis protein CcdA [Edwardsiella piscicida]UCQ23234.1 cytochrome c biogenesis CcdA family protein [Edwardsiella piscicida]UCQ33439.1 cytochrome c biogenesis CcdA family protein [Edwardsiella piscicida]
MEISLLTLGFSLLAGMLTTLSPCVLPILPIVASSAMDRSRWGLLFLAAGMAVAFTLTGVLVASLGFSLGFDGHTLRYGAAVLMLLVALWLLNRRIQAWMSLKTSALTGHGQTWLSTFQPRSAAGQLIVGLLLGLVWTPCIGPTLGAAIALASRGESLLSVSVVMLVFSLGALVPLMAIGMLSRQFFLQRRAKLAQLGESGRKIMGWSLVAVALLVLSGLDKTLEKWLIALSPEWLINLTTAL